MLVVHIAYKGLCISQSLVGDVGTKTKHNYNSKIITTNLPSEPATIKTFSTTPLKTTTTNFNYITVFIFPTNNCI